jgi:hypothetical protein
VRTLRTADQQKVEILRQLVRDTRLIVMDEPTAALTRDEADRLLEITRELRDDGVTVIYVSHILGDVLALCDTITVLKDGRHVKTTPASEETSDSLVTAMLGRSLDVAFPTPRRRRPTRRGAAVRGLSRPPAFQDISFEVRAGRSSGSRAGGQRPHRDRARHLRRRPGRRHRRARRARAEDALAAGEHPPGARAAAREPQGSGPRHGPAAERERDDGPRRHGLAPRRAAAPPRGSAW